MGFCSCFSNLTIGISATLYLIIAVALIAASTATFFTPFGEILEPLYAGSVLGGGIAIFLIAVFGFCAACDKKTTRLLWVFTILTFIIFVLAIAGIVVMFAYEDLLREAAKVNADGGIEAGANVLQESGTTLIKALSTNTFLACGANVSSTAVSGVYTFVCEDDYFETLQATVQQLCLSPARVLDTSINTSQFDTCYSHTFDTWPPSVALTAQTVVATLNTPKGMFCACAKELLESYVLPYIGWAKGTMIGVCAFFALVFVACCHQICCVRGCCGDKAKRREPNGFDSAVQMSHHNYPDPKRGTGKKYSTDAGYMARP